MSQETKKNRTQGVAQCPWTVLLYIWFLNVLYFRLFAVNDALDEIFDESGDEEEQDAIVNQVLDEIGIEISGKVSSINSSVFSRVFIEKTKQIRNGKERYRSRDR